MDITRSLKFAFKDTEWFKKFCIGVGVLLVPIVNFAWYGYLLETARRVSQGNDTLPDWNRFGNYFNEGLKFGIGRLIYFIPQLIISFGALISTQMYLLSQINSGDLFTTYVKMMLIIVPIAAFSTLYQMAFEMVQPEMVINNLRHNSFGSMFNWRQFWNLFSSDRGEFLKASGYSILLIIMGKAFQIGLQVLLSFMPGIGNFFAVLGALMATIWAELATFHYYGQLHGKLTQVE